MNPQLFILDQQDSRAQRLSVILNFIHEPHAILTEEQLTTTLNADPKAVVLLGALTSQQHEQILQQHPACAFLLLGETLKPLLKHANAVGLLTEPFAYASLTQQLRDCQEYHRLLPGQRQHDLQHRFVGMVGTSPVMQQVRFLIQQVAKTDANVLILGESGTGKEVVARNIHVLSHRCDGPFVPINCGAIPAELLESELFGHEKGAFTGAISTRKGRFELAQGGTIFLDEIGDMPLPMQVKLLRVLQEGTFYPVGGREQKKIDIRLVSATNAQLPELVKQGRFREDLYYRIKGITLETPALDERREDVPLLIQHFLQQVAAKSAQNVQLAAPALQWFLLRPWPGNVRELRNTLESVVAIARHGVVQLADIQLLHLDAQESAFADVQLPPGSSLDEQVRQLEIRLLSEALTTHQGNRSQAARQLGLSRQGLLKKIERYGLQQMGQTD